MKGKSSETNQLELTGIPSENAVAIARLHGEPVFQLPLSLYIPPDALEVFLSTFEGPLDFLLFLIRQQKFDIMDIPVAELTEQYLFYVEQIRDSDLEQVGEYLLMAAYLIEIKTKTMLPVEKNEQGEEIDPRAEIVRQLVEREKLQKLANYLDSLPLVGRDFEIALASNSDDGFEYQPQISSEQLSVAWKQVLTNLHIKSSHKITRQELSEREFMTVILRKLNAVPYLRFTDLFDSACSIKEAVVFFIALLELQKEGLVRITQAVPFTPIFIQTGSGLRLKSS